MGIKVGDLTGKKYGMLTIISQEFVQRKNSDRREQYATCKCDCGNTTFVNLSSLRHGRVSSCGCLREKYYKEFKNMVTKPPGVHAMNERYGGYKISAKRRNIPFELTTQEFYELTQQNCHYCGKEPSQVMRAHRSNGPFIYNGIDRVNNDIGYVYSNCVPCCKVCNQIKRTMNVEEMRNHLHKMIDNEANWYK